MKPSEPRKSLREYISGLSVPKKIAWAALIGYIVGHAIFLVASLLKR